MPLFHVGGSAGSHLGALTSQGTFVLQPQFDAGDMLRIVETERVNHIHGVPTMVVRMLDHPDRASRNLSSLRTLMSGGSLVPDWLVRRAQDELGSRFTITYGQTEANGVICQTSPDDTLERQTTSIGRPALRAELKIADPITGAIRPLLEPGEIWVRGYQVMHGYFSLPPGAEDAVTADGWLRTGDVAVMDDAGYLSITGRLKDCIIRGGENIYPMEIEDVLRQHVAVQDVQIVGEPDAQWGEWSGSTRASSAPPRWTCTTTVARGSPPTSCPCAGIAWRRSRRRARERSRNTRCASRFNRVCSHPNRSRSRPASRCRLDQPKDIRRHPP
jgi:fatty-acyl-CoA synthase